MKQFFFLTFSWAFYPLFLFVDVVGINYKDAKEANEDNGGWMDR
jgi:hypothetical protein